MRDRLKTKNEYSPMLLVIAAFVFVGGAMIGSDALMAAGAASLALFVVVRSIETLTRKYQVTLQPTRGSPHRR